MTGSLSSQSGARRRGGRGRCQALGVIGEPNHPKVLEMIDMIVKKVRAAGKAAGIIASDAEKAKALIAQGFQLIIVGSDQNFIQTLGKQYIKAIRG